MTSYLIHWVNVDTLGRKLFWLFVGGMGFISA